MSWIFFAIMAPALYGVTNFIDKFIIEKYFKDPVVLTIVGGGISFALGFGILAIRGFPVLNPAPLALIVLSGALVTLALMPYFKAMALDDTSRITPLFQIIPLIVLVLSYLFLGERLALVQLLGFCFVLLGGFLLSLKELNFRIFELRKSFWYMMLASLLFASATVIFKFVITPANFWDMIAYELLGGEIIVFLLLLNSDYRKRTVENLRAVGARIWGVFFTNEMIYLLARLVGFYAFALASASLVSVLGGRISTPLRAFVRDHSFGLVSPHTQGGHAKIHNTIESNVYCVDFCRPLVYQRLIKRFRLYRLLSAA